MAGPPEVSRLITPSMGTLSTPMRSWPNRSLSQHLMHSVSSPDTSNLNTSAHTGLSVSLMYRVSTRWSWLRRSPCGVLSFTVTYGSLSPLLSLATRLRPAMMMSWSFTAPLRAFFVAVDLAGCAGATTALAAGAGAGPLDAAAGAGAAIGSACLFVGTAAGLPSPCDSTGLAGGADARPCSSLTSTPSPWRWCSTIPSLSVAAMRTWYRAAAFFPQSARRHREAGT
mmetsp:Transcript_3718/g.11767  ORF Transcript_3718/g.11767 Transcript_3718/m.11767 type:complete len:226 (+) Transcript_3718:2-679(+)